MINFSRTYQAIANTRLHPWLEQIKAGVHQRMDDYTHGNINQWIELLKQFPDIKPDRLELNQKVSIGSAEQLSQDQQAELKELLMKFHPWRKGPFHLFGTHIDTEWRSDWKWERLKDHISPLKDRIVLDVGCGNGYHCWRMAADKPQLVLGIDPSQLFLMQFAIMQQYIEQAVDVNPVHFLPIGFEYLPENLSDQGFDTIFSMGVLYHRRSPIDHILHLKKLLRPGGELVLETLVIDGDDDQCLIPSDRYAQMNNVWFIPTTGMLKNWLQKCNFENVQIANVSSTSTDEQRATEWMTFQSLPDYLDPQDPNRTIEGYPAPKRAVMIATRASKK
ncbi:MAG: tRNA 5-methoxyuridine(34)/uridine 5-oxyacetic acid(34) synthase CmoB [Kangiellaceae bacterium]|nr:tRNA 5-methoxyuridine(34)/uridine 5-oxyacetic acid(34) synthase CmoB [Kangiellaceae bacterium]